MNADEIKAELAKAGADLTRADNDRRIALRKIQTLLRKGVALEPPMKIMPMASLAGISRPTAYKLIDGDPDNDNVHVQRANHAPLSSQAPDAGEL